MRSRIVRAYSDGWTQTFSVSLFHHVLLLIHSIFFFVRTADVQTVFFSFACRTFEYLYVHGTRPARRRYVDLAGASKKVQQARTAIRRWITERERDGQTHVSRHQAQIASPRVSTFAQSRTIINDESSRRVILRKFFANRVNPSAIHLEWSMAWLFIAPMNKFITKNLTNFST